MEKLPRQTVGFDDAAIVGGVRDVAARPAGHEDLHARLAILFQDESLAAALAGPDARHQPRRPGADHNHVPGTILHGYCHKNNSPRITQLTRIKRTRAKDDEEVGPRLNSRPSLLRVIRVIRGRKSSTGCPLRRLPWR